jgi:hypothetical protein
MMVMVMVMAKRDDPSALFGKEEREKQYPMGSR